MASNPPKRNSKTARANPVAESHLRSVNEYRCDDCGWIYRAKEHQGLDIDDQELGWVCERCQAGRDHFQVAVPADDDLTGTRDEEATDPTHNIGAERLIFVRTSDPDVSTLKRRYDKGRLVVRPDFQRYDVWSRVKKSKLIESLLLDLPIPRIYLAEESNGLQIVVDGQQRLLATFQFLDNKLALTGLTILGQLEDLHFRDLSERVQEQIEKFQFAVVEIRQESHEDIKFDLFERLNTGATQLNDQELRNSVYRGDYNDYLKDLAGDPEWRRLLGLKGIEPHKRMADVELVLRFMAFYTQTYLKHPDKKTKEFLNNQMEIGAALKERSLKKARRDFKNAIASVYTVFGSNAGKQFVSGSKDDPQGRWEKSRNRALLDVELSAFASYPRGVITKNTDALREASLELMASTNFSDLVSQTTSEAKRVKSRFRLWTDMVDQVLQGEHQGVRAFDKALKQRLFKSDPTCHICEQAIADIDDAHVDHISPYRGGGGTVEPNAGLAHRFCNMSKGAKTETP